MLSDGAGQPVCPKQLDDERLCVLQELSKGLHLFAEKQLNVFPLKSQRHCRKDSDKHSGRDPPPPEEQRGCGRRE